MTVRIGYAAGAFDLFHIGHLNILRHAREQCDTLIAGVVSDEILALGKGIRPFIPTIERAEIVRSNRFVDEVYIETTLDKLDAWRDVRFTHFFKGDDWRGTEKGAQLERRFETVGVEVVYFPYTAHTSSSQLRRVLEAVGVESPRSDEGTLVSA
ncbi:adenylyltransferase/cytidyltransferase family protein [uncultured Microbacterium sp.]|uniref:adenylyltransferase/cytidyltransferase family protein n=1 Tax=uncultured Microbacterium sp. TaxID=191216 RepID=UPI0028EFDF8C|nr:adenylyltransferase/cytidyltransferase family protein [uncultured Microbacterium sp.]